MAHIMSTALVYFLLLLVQSHVTLAQTVVPFPVHTCNANVAIDIACNNNFKTCCSVGGTCCAGGCCPFDAVCVFKGTSKEACCPLSNPSACGARPVASITPTPVSGGPCPSVVCVNVSKDWYCRHGQICILNCPFPPCCLGAELGCAGTVVSSTKTSTSTSPPAVVVSSSTAPTTSTTKTSTSSSPPPVVVSSSAAPATSTTVPTVTSNPVVTSSSIDDATTVVPTSAATANSASGAAASAATTTSRSGASSAMDQAVGWALWSVLLLVSGLVIVL